MELRHLKYLVTVAEEGNMSRASTRLNVSQPAVSRQIIDLENELGVRLFDRKQNGMRLTEAGETAVWHARQVLERSSSLVNAMHAFSKSEAPRLRIGYIPSILSGFLAEVLSRFNEKHPEICVEIHEMNPASQETALMDGDLDIAFLGHPSRDVERKFNVLPIRKVPMAALVPRSHRLAKRKSLDFKELATEPFLSLDETEFPGRKDLVNELFQKSGLPVKISQKVKAFSEILGLVASGFGVAVIPADISELGHKNVVFIKLQNPKITLVSSVAWRRENVSRELALLLEIIEWNPSA